MSNNRALSVLRNVKDILTGQYADVDLIALSYVDSTSFNFERIALLLDSIAPLLERFGTIVLESSSYIQRQQASARRFRLIMFLVMGFMIYGCLNILYRYGNHPGAWHVRAAYYLSVVIACIFVILFVRVMIVTVNTRTERVNAIKTGDLVGYKLNLSDNLFIRFVNARLKGPEAVKGFRSEMVQEMQQDFDETNQFDFCSQTTDSSKKMEAKCLVLDPCTPDVVSLTLPDVLRRHYARGPRVPCAAVLRQLFQSLQDVRDGTKVSQLDQYLLWSQITRGVETMRSLLTMDTAAKSEVNLSGKRMLEIIKEQVIGTMAIDLVEISNLAVPQTAPAELVEAATNKSECWRECMQKGSRCRWAKFDSGRCMVGSADVVPGTVSSVFEYRVPSATEAGSQSILVRGGKVSLDAMARVVGVDDRRVDDREKDLKSKTLSMPGDELSKSTAYVCAKGIAEQSLNNATPLVYSGKLTIDTCARGADCSLVAFKNSDATNSVPSVAGFKQDAGLKAWTASEGESYRVVFSPTTPLVQQDSMSFCRKTTPRDLFVLNPERLVQTYTELEPHIRGQLMFAMENYAFRVPLQAYRAYILDKLRTYYGDSFPGLAPYLLETLVKLEESVADARRQAEKNARYVTLQRFQNRILKMTSKQRNDLSTVAAEMSNGAYLQDRYFKPVASTMSLNMTHTLLVYGILIVVVGCTIFLVMQIACLKDGTCSGSVVMRNTVILSSIVLLLVTLCVTAYRKAEIRRRHNVSVSEANGRMLVQKTAELLQALTGSSRFTVQVTLMGVNGAEVPLSSVTKGAAAGNAKSRNLEVMPNAMAEGLEAEGTHPGALQYRSVRLYLISAKGTTALRIRSVRVGDVQNGFAYTFSRADAVGLVVGQAIDIPVSGRQAYFKPTSGAVFDAQIWTSENISDFGSLYSLSKTVVETYDKCNSLTSGMRTVPYPIMDIVVMASLIGLVLLVIGLIINTLQPVKKVQNVRSLFKMRKKIRMGEIAPEFDSLITCCKTGKDVWQRLLNIAVIIMFSFAIYATLTLRDSVADYAGGLSSSIEYVEGRCA